MRRSRRIRQGRKRRIGVGGVRGEAGGAEGEAVAGLGDEGGVVGGGSSVLSVGNESYGGQRPLRSAIGGRGCLDRRFYPWRNPDEKKSK